MKITHTILWLSFFFSSVSIAQKVDLDKEYWDYYVMVPPQLPNFSQAETYTMNIFCSPENAAKLGITPAFVTSNFYMESLRYIDGSADALIEIEIDDFRDLGSIVNSRQTITKDAAGKEVTKSVYFAQSSYAARTTITVFDGATSKDLSQNVFFSESNPCIVESSGSDNIETAKSTLRSEEEKRFAEFKRRLQEGISKGFEQIRSQYDFRIEKRVEAFFHFDEKKNPEYKEFNQKLLGAKTAVEILRPNQGKAVYQEKLTPYILYFSTSAAAITGDDKPFRKARYAHYLVQARLETWLEVYDQSDATCKRIVDNDYDEVYGKTHMLVNKQARATLAKYNLTTFFIDRPGFSSTSKVSYNKMQKKVKVFAFPTPPRGLKAYPGHILKYTKEKIVGQLWVSDINSVHSLGAPETKFVYEEGGNLKETTLVPSQIDEISCGRDYIVKTMKFKNNIAASEDNLFFRILYEGPKMNLLSYYPTKGELSGFKNIKPSQIMSSRGDYCGMNTETKIIEPICGYTLGLNAVENCAEFYKTCPTLSNKIRNKEYPGLTNLATQVKLAEEYNNNCQ